MTGSCGACFSATSISTSIGEWKGSGLRHSELSESSDDEDPDEHMDRASDPSES
jgi:hypothetical protein